MRFETQKLVRVGNIKIDVPSKALKQIGTMVEEELIARLNKQIGVDKRKFPKKLRPELSGSSKFLIDTGKSTKIKVNVIDNFVKLRPARPEILKFHYDRAPWFSLDEAFSKKISKKITAILRPLIRKQMKK